MPHNGLSGHFCRAALSLFLPRASIPESGLARQQEVVEDEKPPGTGEKHICEQPKSEGWEDLSILLSCDCLNEQRTPLVGYSEPFEGHSHKNAIERIRVVPVRQSDSEADADAGTGGGTDSAG
jgi:hypothetical protein